MEVVAVKVCNLSICTVYVPPISSKEYHLDMMAYLASLDSNNLLIVGDFNCPDVIWPSLTASTPFSNDLCDFVFNSNLTQLVSCPTHVKGNILDLILTSNEESIFDLKVHESPVKTDHLMLSFHLYINMIKCHSRKSTVVFDYKKADWRGLCDYLLDCDFSACYDSQDVELIWSAFKLIVLPAMDCYIPKVRLRSHQYPVWYTPELRHSQKCLQTLRKNHNKRSSSLSKQKLNIAEEKFKIESSQAKCKYESSLMYDLSTKENTKAYKYIRSLKDSGGIPKSVYYNSIHANTPLDKATLFNDYFHSVFYIQYF